MGSLGGEYGKYGEGVRKERALVIGARCSLYLRPRG